MEEIKVGEYVRTKKGEICKVLGIRPEVKTGKRIYGHKAYYLDRRKGSLTPAFITKHSLNLIDLIEYGDLVKFKGWGSVKGIDVIDMRTNEKINLVFPDAEFCNGWSDTCMIYDLDYLIEKNQSKKIDWVLTHEQIKERCYKVEE